MAMNKKELVAKAVELELGSPEDLDKFTKEELVKLIGPDNLGSGDGNDDETEADPKTAELAARRKAKAGPVKHKYPGMTVVEDLIDAGLVPVAKPAEKE